MKKKIEMVDVVLTVKCSTCGKTHEMESDTFVVVWGNVTIGVAGKPIIDGNLDDKRKLRSTTILCRDKCFVEAMNIGIGKEKK